jgi:hypothetical protein
MLRQVERWLAANFPTALPVRVYVRDLTPPVQGKTQRSRDEFTLTLARTLVRPGWQLSHEVLIHEWAHAFSWRPHLEEDEVFAVDHNEEWALAYGRIYRAFFDEGGDNDSNEFSPRPFK